MRTMCTYEHGIRDKLRVIKSHDTAAFNNELQRSVESGWRIIQPIETHVVAAGESWSHKLYHIAVLAAPKDANEV